MNSARQNFHSPPTKHKIDPVLDNLELNKLMISDLNQTGYAVVIESHPIRNVEIVVEAASAVCLKDFVSVLPSLHGRYGNSRAQMRWMECPG
jgi:hypothetical protein